MTDMRLLVLAGSPSMKRIDVHQLFACTDTDPVAVPTLTPSIFQMCAARGVSVHINLFSLSSQAPVLQSS